MGLADTFRGIFQSFGMDVSRSNSLLIVTTFCLLPLCLLKNLAALAPFSLAGIVAMLFAGCVMAARYLGGGYALGSGEGLEAGGRFLADVAEEFVPKFGSDGAMSVFRPGTFVFVCMLSTAFMAHFNAPKFYLELKDNTVPRFNRVVNMSFLFSVLIQAAIMAVGFLTFGTASSGLVLNNYSPRDALVSVARIAVAFSVVFTYPMPFVGCRDGVLDLMEIPRERRTDAYVNSVTVTLLGLVTAAALKFSDISFVLSFGGATLGNALIYVFPALMFRGAVRSMGESATEGLKRETTVAAAHMVLGVVLGTLGAIYAVKGTGGGH
uniref:Amino acid transporter transmembrane domain-containing protein n=2 Tax=Odontella aurita TaxID=265563 RepID=A0A7S4JMK3_9STRA|mmetsp:Transcript_4971/g.14249  ORF Transcript_4971/g.14249 Transcript_4971/m.14249 type:complete len:323 (+) Transcript_4971:1357-2325(+)